MSPYSEHQSRHRRLSILRILLEAPGYVANDSLLSTIVNDFGIVSTRDQVRSELAWLASAGFVATKEVASVTIATLTEAGADTAVGRRSDPGVAKPSPKG